MPLVSAKCTNCGANLNVDNTNEAAVCQFCGSAFIVEKAINNYNTTITTNIGSLHADVLQVNDESSIDNKVKSANTFIQLNDFVSASRIFDEITTNFPYDYRGWWGKIRVLTHDFNNFALSDDSYTQAKSLYTNVEKVASTENLNQVKSIFEQYCISREQNRNALCNEHQNNVSHYASEVQKWESTIEQTNIAYSNEVNGLASKGASLQKKEDWFSTISTLFAGATALSFIFAVFSFLWAILTSSENVNGLGFFAIPAIFLVVTVLLVKPDARIKKELKSNSKCLADLESAHKNQVSTLQSRLDEAKMQLEKHKTLLSLYKL